MPDHRGHVGRVLDLRGLGHERRRGGRVRVAARVDGAVEAGEREYPAAADRQHGADDGEDGAARDRRPPGNGGRGGRARSGGCLCGGHGVPFLAPVVGDRGARTNLGVGGGAGMGRSTGPRTYFRRWLSPRSRRSVASVTKLFRSAALADAAGAAAYAVACLVVLLLQPVSHEAGVTHTPDAAAFVLLALATLPLALRRKAPIVVAAVVVPASIAGSLAGYALNTTAIGALFALASAAYLSDRRRSIAMGTIAGARLLVGLLVAGGGLASLQSVIANVL